MASFRYRSGKSSLDIRIYADGPTGLAGTSGTIFNQQDDFKVLDVVKIIIDKGMGQGARIHCCYYSTISKVPGEIQSSNGQIFKSDIEWTTSQGLRNSKFCFHIRVDKDRPGD